MASLRPCSSRECMVTPTPRRHAVPEHAAKLDARSGCVIELAQTLPPAPFPKIDDDQVKYLRGLRFSVPRKFLQRSKVGQGAAERDRAARVHPRSAGLKSALTDHRADSD